MQIDYDLPSVTLPEVSDLAKLKAKYAEELAEWRKEPEGSMSQLIELWDVIHCCWTWVENGGDSMAIEAYFSARRSMEKHIGTISGTLAIDLAKRATLFKNAKRGYYAPSVCQRIIETGGAEWKPENDEVEPVEGVRR